MNTQENTVKRYRRQFDPDYRGCKGEVNTGPSMTEPDQTLSLQTLLINHTRSVPSDVNIHEGTFTEEQIAPDFQDLTDAEIMKEELQEREKELQAKVDQELDELRLKHELEELDKINRILEASEEEKEGQEE